MVIIQLNDQISITANPDKKILTIKVDYSKVIDYTKKANKEVFANAYYKKLNDYFTLNIQLLGQKIKAEVVDVKGIDL